MHTDKILTVFFISIINLTNAQCPPWSINLVPNPGFENYSSLPSQLGQHSQVNNWSNTGSSGTPDFFHLSGSGAAGLPNCQNANVSPRTGNAIMGFATFLSGFSNGREYINSQLTTPLTPGVTYNVSFYVTNGFNNGTYCGMSCNNIGAHLSVGATNQAGFAPIGITPTYNNTSVFYDSTWQLMSFQYTPTAPVDYITIGNFYNDAATTSNVVIPVSTYAFSYVFIDDVCVSIASSFSTSNNDTICINDSVQIWSNGVGPFSWVDSSDFSTILGVTDSIYVSLTSTTTYGVYNSTDTSYVTVVVLPADTIGFTYTFPDPCDSSIVEFTATSTGQMDSVWWSMGFPGGSGLTGMTETVNFSQVKTYNINLWIYGSCGWIDTTIAFTVPSGPTDHYVLNNENINYCQGDPIVNLTLTDTSSLGAGGIIDWYSDATLTTNIGSGLTLIPDTVIGNYTYYITETLPCGTRIIDSIFINIYDCYCPNNLVPNSGFETYTTCPTGGIGADNIAIASPWDNPPKDTAHASSDYLNTCYTTLLTTPNTGTGYALVAIYIENVEYREYVQVPLNQPLTKGKCYQSSMHVTAYKNTGAITDSIGMYFSVGAPSGGMPDPIGIWGPGPGQGPWEGEGVIDAIPQVTNDASVDMSSYDWQYVSGTFTAIGDEDYLTIGSFTSDSNTSATILSPFPDAAAAYLIDDVCLYEIPADTVDVNLIDTTSCSSITLSGPNGYNQYSWYDTSNALVSTTQSLNVTSLGTSTYILYSSDTNACPRTYYRDTVNATIGNTDVINFSYDYPDPCDSTILELTATSTGPIDSIWWSFGFMGGGNPIWNNPIVDFPGDSTFNVNLSIYGSCGWIDIIVPVTIIVPEPTPNYELANYNQNYCVGDAMTDITVVDSSGGGGVVNWYSDAAFTNNVGTGTTLSPDTALGSYTYFAVETLTCGYRVIDSISIMVTTCASCPGNLIPNPGFESITGCPTGSTFIEYAVPWNDPPPAPTQATCDLFNNCTSGNLSVVPHTGNGYAGFIPYSPGSEYREYPQAPLSQPLVAGRCYQSSMYVTLGASSQYTIDSLGIAFTNGAVVQGTPGGTFQPGQGLITASPQVVNDGSVDLSSSDWQLISGQFMAAGGEDHITVGNFTPNANLTPVFIGLFQSYAYYYVDDICLYEMSADTVDAIAISDTTNCDTINLNAPSGYNKYQWEDLSNVIVSNSQDFSISAAGTSTVVLYYADTTSCPLTYYRDTITVTINTAPDAGTDHEIGICTQQIAFNLFDSIPGAPDTGGIWLPTLSSGANVFDPLTDAAGIYQYVSGLGGACGTDTAAITVTINATAPPTTSDTSICFNDVTAPLVALGDNINWYTDPALTGLVFQGDSFFAPDIAVGSYTYWATETDSVTGCESASDSAVYTINPIPVPPAASDTSVCFGQTAPGLTAIGTSIQWYNTFSLDSLLGSGANYVTGDTAMGPHEYYVTQTIAGCESSPDSATLTIVPMPTLIISDDIVISAGETTALVVSGAGNYLWSTGAIADNIFVAPQQTTTYTVTGFNGLGCSAEISVTVTVLEEENVVYLPNVFSGNSSNPEHKRLYVFGKGIETLELSIYERWGNKVYVTTDANSKPRSSDGLCCAYGEGWDGTYMNTGKPLNTAVFVYKLKVTFNNGEEYFENGNITLLK